jgi:23S rRNA (uracil1939-C5)-methyltransferase
LEDVLWHVGRLKPEQILRPMAGPDWGYRYRARLSARFVAKKNQVLVGFHERQSRYVADMSQCPVLPPAVSGMLPALKDLLGSMDAKASLPQIEVACGDQGVIALVLRHMEALTEADTARLQAFAKTAPGVQWWLQPGGNETVHRMNEADPPLAYSLPAFGITMPFRPTDFTQVNPSINEMLVSRAITLLAVQPTERVIDWFCGLGNFTLPLATRARAVLGVEGSDTLVQRAKDNYVANQAARAGHQQMAPTDFVARDLFDLEPETLCADGTAEKWLVDPPREGAFALVQALAKAVAAYRSGALARGFDWAPPARIVYVSCNPATLARDAQVLSGAGYSCKAAGVINMFPHTAHVESMAVFDWIG